MINSLLPEDLRNDNRLFDKNNLDDLLAEVARRYPDRYGEIAKKVSDVGRQAAFNQGETLTLKDFRPVFDKGPILAQMDQELAMVDAEDLPDTEKAKRRIVIWSKYSNDLEKQTTRAALSTGNALGGSVISGARGKPLQLKAMLTTPAIYTDYRDEPIPLFVRSGFNEGLRPYEYLASSYGTRKGVISTKNATQESGDLAKQLVQATTPVVVTEDDCGSTNGLDFDPDDSDIDGRVLAKDYGHGLKAGTVIDKHVHQELRRWVKNKVIVRSPMTCQAKRGICAHCLGTLPDGKFAHKGYAAGITASQAVTEPLTQGALNTKHGGGALSAGKTFAGFDVINQLVQSPETFPFKAAVANEAGTVKKIEDAPQGGKMIYVGNTPHYSLPGYEPTVRPGDPVEAGDQLSEGIVDVADIIRTRGLGEARRYYVDRLKQAFEDSGAGQPSKINLETMARGALDHVVIRDPEGIEDALPDDLASYNQLSASYSPPKSMKMAPIENAHGQYLQAPVLHFTIGTKLTPKMTDRMRKAGIKAVPVSEDEPKFEPVMHRLRTASENNTDWLARMHTSYLTKSLATNAPRSQTTNVEHNYHFAPRLMIGENFGKKVEQTGEF